MTLHANNLKKSYGSKQVISDVSLQVSRAQVVGVLGPNGAGKTTCFYMICGLISADGGNVTLDGNDITNLPIHLRADMGLGYLPQEPSIFRGLTVEQNIMSVLEIRHKNKQERAQKLEQLLTEFSISHVRHSPSPALSGGERRRLEIARLLAADPSFILLDEPLAGVDPIAVAEVRSLISRLKERGIGVLITDHNVRETLSMVDHAYIIHNGHVLMDGTAQEIAANEDVRSVYLGENFHL